MGLDLKNPIVVASSGLTNSVAKIKELEQAGAGAIIVKSLFEEQITGESAKLMAAGEAYPEAADYINAYVRQNALGDYVELLAQAKKSVSIPLIASISCVSDKEWVSFAQKLEDAGADALELNMFYVPTSRKESAEDIEQRYLNMLSKVKKETKLPVAVKIGSYFTNIIAFVEKLQAHGANSITMFNRFYEPDINIKTLKMTASTVFSQESDLRHSLRWVGIASAVLPQMQIAASTGIHSGEAVVKQLLAGAQVTQVCSAIYKDGAQAIASMLQELQEFMAQWNFQSIEEFRARLSYKGMDPMMYERAQFMRYFSDPAVKS